MSKETEKKELDEKKAKAREANANQNNERLKLMEQIADTSEVERKLESTEEVPVKEPEEKPPEEPVEEPEEEPKEEAVPGDEKEINGVMHYLTIVNGQERWQTLKQLREVAQKVESADEYLRTAAEAARREAAVVPSKDESPSLGEDEIADLYRKQALGDEDAIRTLAKLTARPSGITPDILQALDQRLSFRTELASLEAESSDLLKDPYMGRLFRTRLQEIKQEAPTTRLADAYHSVDKEIRRAFPGFKSSKLQEKLERKRTLPQISSAATRQTNEAEEEGEEDPSAVIERMAKARGISPHTYSPRKQ